MKVVVDLESTKDSIDRSIKHGHLGPWVFSHNWSVQNFFQHMLLTLEFDFSRMKGVHLSSLGRRSEKALQLMGRMQLLEWN